MEFDQTDVSTGFEAPASDASVESAAAPSPGGIGGEAPAAVETAPVAETVTTEPAGESATPFELPENDDDLKGQEHQPHVQGLIQLREQLRADRIAHQEAIKPWSELEQQHGSREVVQRNLGLVDGLFGTNERGEPTTQPFIDGLRELSPSTYLQTMQDGLAAPHPTKPDSTIWEEGMRSIGLDPTRIADYQALTKGTYAPPSAINPEFLKEIADDRKDAFKALNPVQHEHWHEYTDDEKKVFLDNQQKEIDRDRSVAELQQREQQRQQQDQLTRQREIETLQETAVDTERSESFGFVLEELQKQWTPSGDPVVNNANYATVGLACIALIEPKFRGLADAQMKAAGINVDYGRVDEAVNKLVTRAHDRVAAEKSGEVEKARRASVDVANAKRQLTSLFGDVATRFAAVRGGALDATRQTTNGAIDAAQGVRPAISGTPSMPAMPTTRISGDGKIPGSVWQEIGANTRKSVAQ